ncbi:tetratricopeptide repeat protein [Paenibacillus sp. S25]|uniref:tetratricopeptide repeat protein n=1 Tax=Paenibacillus sp. S25 TaxID=2823905 RepID=UPI001C648D1E|nr:tetratricopeptide repeat protein [Paenibacillus sp. S25]QYK62752.1 Tetratricopeptide repeat protein [Paenibacillus sp. S25]
MFQHVFAEMNSMLDDIVKHYPSAQGSRRQELLQHWSLLRRMSDGIMDEWLAFEEKMVCLRAAGFSAETDMSDTELPEKELPAFNRGQGYYRLLMYPEAIQQFEQVLQHFPNSWQSRMYMGMSYFQLDDPAEAVYHFQKVLDLTEQAGLKAVIYNALGCLLAKQADVEEAQKCFALAHQFDPALPEPLHNMEACLSGTEMLRYDSSMMTWM